MCFLLKDVTVHWQNAIAPEASAFDNIHPEAALHVPPGTAASYQANAVWSSNFTITVTPPTAIDAAQAAAFIVRPLGGALQISGLSIGEELSVYTISGRVIYKGKATASEIYLPINVRGALIVVAGKRSVKTVLN
ncbi:MAG: hypothetical protein LBC81_01915 [Tannerellaceae bacterium]|jgi:hypothetical protein|nr:hypothetical protein [Tannerellaceae bacterium]